MLQSSGALSVYTKSICLFGKFGLPGPSIDVFYNRFYLIQLNFKITHCTECGRGADYRSHPQEGKRDFRPSARQIALSPTHRRAAKRATPLHNPLQRHPPRFPSCQNPELSNPPLYREKTHPSPQVLHKTAISCSSHP